MGFAEENAKFFDTMVTEYGEKEWQKELYRQLTTAFRDNLDWIGVNWITDEERAAKSREVRLLDYACGTGFISRSLGPYVTSSTGLDVSTKMVERYNKAFEETASSDNLLTPASAAVGNLFADPPSPELEGEEYHGFDIAAVGMAFHHFEDSALAAKRLAERLKPGGVLLIVDFLHGHDHGASHSHGHGHGHDHQAPNPLDTIPDFAKGAIKVVAFGEDSVRADFAAAGLEDFKIIVLPEKARIEFEQHKSERTVFIARARKPL